MIIFAIVSVLPFGIFIASWLKYDELQDKNSKAVKKWGSFVLDLRMEKKLNEKDSLT